MPLPAEDVLKNLVKATQEAKDTIKELHEARATAIDVDKKNRERITSLIVTEVEKQVGELASDVREQMTEACLAIIDGFATDWRKKLGLELGG